MFLRTVDVLEMQTKDFWRLSNIRTGRIKERITVEQIINSVNNLEFKLGPHRPLLKSVRSLGEAIVQGKGKKAATPATISILPRSLAVLAGGSNA
jgi:hypothetical protein